MRHPTEILKGGQRKEWQQIEGSIPGPSRTSQQPSAPNPRPSTPPAPQSPTPSEREIEQEILGSGGVEDDPDEFNRNFWVNKAVWDGGVINLLSLLAKAIPPMASATTDPKTWGYKDVARLPELEQKEWQDACLRELEALERRNIFELVDRPKGHKVIKNRWVFDQKSDGRKRARLVAKGFSQVEGLDYNQIFSPVVRFETVRLILAMAALHDWHITGLDVRNAFLYGELDEEIYMEQPEGFRVPGHLDAVFRLIKALYGLKQAGLAWWRMLRESMIELGFENLVSDTGLYIFRNECGFVIAVIYVDDAIFCRPNKTLVQELKNKFMQRWEVRDLGNVTKFLHMHIIKIGRTINIDQCDYLNTMLQCCRMENAESAATPLPAGYMPEPVAPDATIDPELRSRYQTVIGSLLYLTLGT